MTDPANRNDPADPADRNDPTGRDDRNDPTDRDDDTIAGILAETRRIAVVGASANPSRPSHRVMKSLLDAGYEVVPVNPNAATVHGIEALDSLDDLTEPVDLVDVFRRAEAAPDVARAAARIGARALWLQQGLRSEEARRLATDAGLRYVEDQCLAVVVDRARHRHDPA